MRAHTYTHARTRTTHPPTQMVSFPNMVTLLGRPIHHHLPVAILAPLCRGTEPYYGVFLYSPKFAFLAKCVLSLLSTRIQATIALPGVANVRKFALPTVAGRSLCTVLLSAGTAGPPPGSSSLWPQRHRRLISFKANFAPSSTCYPEVSCRQPGTSSWLELSWQRASHQHVKYFIAPWSFRASLPWLAVSLAGSYFWGKPLSARGGSRV